MDVDSPRESESTSMDIDDGAVPRHHSHHCDSVKLNSCGFSGGRLPPDFHPQEHEIVGSVQTSIHGPPSHPTPGHERLSDSGGFPQLMIPPSPSSPVNHPGEMGDVHRGHGLAMQRRGILLGLEPSVEEVMTRKRKRTHDSPHTHIVYHTHQDNDATDGANPHSPRRIRPRLWIPQNREFSPLLFIPSGEERGPLVEEGTIGVFHHPSNVTNLPHAIQRRFHLGDPSERDPCTLRSSSSPEANDSRDHKELKCSDSTSSFEQVALASTVAPKHGRLSTLQDFWLPRPFAETERPSTGIIKVHERGLDAGPSFLSTNSGGRASREPAGSPTDITPGHDIQAPIHVHDTHTCSPRSVVMLPLEPSSTNFFDKPICDSPDPIDPTDEDGLTHFELPAIQATRARFQN